LDKAGLLSPQYGFPNVIEALIHPRQQFIALVIRHGWATTQSISPNDDIIAALP
jgi:hypothetical protein